MASRQSEPAPVAVTIQPEISVQITTPSDPWESEELDEYGSLVEWESWEDQS
jgi:hypothetical protein